MVSISPLVAWQVALFGKIKWFNFQTDFQLVIKQL
jgi:hypothetical protein